MKNKILIYAFSFFVILVGAGLLYYFAFFLPNYKEKELNLRIENEKIKVQQLENEKQEKEAEEDAKNQNSLSQKCKQMGEDYYKENYSKVAIPLKPSYVYSKKAQACLFLGGQIGANGFLNKEIINLYTNETIFSVAMINGNYLDQKICGKSCVTKEEFEIKVNEYMK